MELGKKIIALRKTNRMTQSDLGAKLNVTFQAVSKWERGESYPDFDTLSKMAKIFDVPIGYFEDGAEAYSSGVDSFADTAATDTAAANNAAAATAAVLGGDRAVVGFCKECGKIVSENDETGTTPVVICKACAIRRENARRASEKAKEETLQKERRAAAARERARVQNVLHGRNRGLIWAAPLSAIWLILIVIGGVENGESVGLIAGISIVTTLIMYTFIAQLFWDGIVRDVCLSGGKLVGMPGVIFSLDLDGFIFLVAVKIIFAFIKLMIFLLTLLFTVIVAYIISPFTFVPQCLKLSAGKEL